MTRVGRKLVDESGTLAGATITLIDAVRTTATALGLPLASALTMATLTPARLLGLGDRIGRLAPGCEANLVHLTDALAVAGVWMNGRVVAEDGEPRQSDMY
jgi:N-acetylglucosamine-6-phosphate deacetylase